VKLAIDSSLGLHDDALRLRGQRASVLASNIANADTPNYKARDLDFQSTLQRTVKSQGMRPVQLAQTNNAHIAAQGTPAEGELMYRNPLQASLDGNTVDAHVEHTKFAENALRYQASLQFLGDRFRGLRNAIKGE
jgi:flagellar basal-body rod protein FlgB